MNKKVENVLIYWFSLILVVGSVILIIRFAFQPDPNLYAFIIFLLAIFIILLFHDKIEEFVVSKEGIELKLKTILHEFQKEEINENDKRKFEKRYNTKYEIRKIKNEKL